MRLLNLPFDKYSSYLAFVVGNGNGFFKFSFGRGIVANGDNALATRRNGTLGPFGRGAAATGRNMFQFHRLAARVGEHKGIGGGLSLRNAAKIMTGFDAERLVRGSGRLPETRQKSKREANAEYEIFHHAANVQQI